MDESITCRPLEATYYGSFMNGWMNPNWVEHNEDVGFHLGDLTCHPLGAAYYDSAMNGWTQLS